MIFLIQTLAGMIYVKEKIKDIIETCETIIFEEYLLPAPYLGYEFEP